MLPGVMPRVRARDTPAPMALPASSADCVSGVTGARIVADATGAFLSASGGGDFVSRYCHAPAWRPAAIASICGGANESPVIARDPVPNLAAVRAASDAALRNACTVAGEDPRPINATRRGPDVTPLRNRISSREPRKSRLRSAVAIAPPIALSSLARVAGRAAPDDSATKRTGACEAAASAPESATAKELVTVIDSVDVMRACR